MWYFDKKKIIGEYVTMYKPEIMNPLHHRPDKVIKQDPSEGLYYVSWYCVLKQLINIISTNQLTHSKAGAFWDLGQLPVLPTWWSNLDWIKWLQVTEKLRKARTHIVCVCYNCNTIFCVSRQMVYDPEDPRCARLTLTGKMVEVAPEELMFAKEAMFSRWLSLWKTQ